MRNPGLTPVVVGVNGTPAGLAAARLGAREAVVRGLPLRVVHVFTGQRTRSFDDAPDWPGARRESGELVAEAVATASRAVPGVHVEGLILDGPPVRELLRQSRTAALLVIGGDDCAGTPRLPTDSVLVQTVSRSRCPVLVARGIRPPAGPVLTATDGSASALLALRTAAAEGRRRGVPVEVIHVVETAGGEAAGRRLLADAVAAVPELRTAGTRLMIGEPAGNLVRAARRGRMMIVGPRGAGGGTLLGGVGLQLLRRCACPTVFVHGNPAGDTPAAGTVPTAGALIS
ncbi:universal stress protein [Actinoplanes sp. NPDC049668]|uniref:universal stress protein n=1 Tax=Actinoplanes sp. NPDC049668 TaxID=3363904 RepID=UPI0037927EB6